MKKTLRVAAIQLECRDLQVRDNLERAALLVESAARRGAQIVLLPELLAAGYRLTPELWDCAESADGPTECWLKEMGAAHKVWIGTTYLQADGDDFLNTFALADPSGRIAGRVHKEAAPAIEAFFFRGRKGSHVIDTPLGRIGVSICFEGWLASVVENLREEGAELVLMPHSAPTPSPAFGFSQADADSITDAARDVPQHLAWELGVPTVMANKAGPWRSPSPMPFPANDSRFPGLSAIVDCHGKVVARLGSEEGVIVSDVQIDCCSLAAGKRRPARGKWARPVPRGFRVFPISQTLGTVAYLLSGKRREMARKLNCRKSFSDDRSAS